MARINQTKGKNIEVAYFFVVWLKYIRVMEGWKTING